MVKSKVFVYLRCNNQINKYKMDFKKAKLGLEVVRSKGDYVVGRTGNVIELDDIKKRVRVQWGNLKTWVKVEAVEPTSIPYEIISYYNNPKYRNKRTGLYPNPKYVRK